MGGDRLAAIGSTRQHLAFKSVAEEWLSTEGKTAITKRPSSASFLVP
jgi:hypothetical protein